MFASTEQMHTAIRTILAIGPGIEVDKVWTLRGPTTFCAHVLDGSEDEYLSDGEHLLVRVAFDLYNGAGRALVRDVIAKLDARCAGAVAELLVAAIKGGPAVDAWLATYRKE
jgi:hypothetical protein